MRGRWLSSSRTFVASPLASSRGVSTVELAAVIAITLVMAALAVAAYRTYAARAEVRTGVAAVARLQELVKDAFDRTGMPPATEHDVPGLEGATPHDRSIEAVAIENGRIEIRFGNEAAARLRGQSLYVTPFETMEGEVLWLCGNRKPEVGLYPLGLYSGAQPPPPPATTVEPRYLPTECR